MQETERALGRVSERLGIVMEECSRGDVVSPDELNNLAEDLRVQAHRLTARADMLALGCASQGE